MTNEEAIKLLIRIKDHDWSEEYKEALSMAIAALKRKSQADWWPIGHF